MKVSEIVDTQINDMQKVGMVPRYITMTCRALELLVKESEELKDPAKFLDDKRADGDIFYRNLPVILAWGLERFCPVCVSGGTQDELRVYNMKTSDEA